MSTFLEIEFDDNFLSARDAAARVMDSLKAKGHWRISFDSQGLPAVFVEAAKSSHKIQFGDGKAKTPLEVVADLIAQVSPRVVNGMLVDPESVEMAEAASTRAREKNISYGEAFTEVRAQCRDRHAFAPSRGMLVDPKSVRKDAIVRELMSADSALTYGEALTQVNHINFDDMPDVPIRPALIQKADQRSASQNIPFAKALLQVLNEVGFPWQQDKTLRDLNAAYGNAPPRVIEPVPGQKQIDPAQFTTLAQNRAKSEGIPFDKALKQVQLENEVESTWGNMRPQRTQLNV